MHGLPCSVQRITFLHSNNIHMLSLIPGVENSHKLPLFLFYREQINPEPCQNCLNVPEIRKTEPSHSEVNWERRCPVHHCPIDTSPSPVRYHQPSSSHMHAPISTRSNGQVPSGSQDSFQPHLYYHCNQQETRSSYALPHLPGHGERATLCSHHSSGDLSSSPQHETTESRWKQWPQDQQQLRRMQHHIVTVRQVLILTANQMSPWTPLGNMTCFTCFVEQHVS